MGLLQMISRVKYIKSAIEIHRLIAELLTDGRYSQDCFPPSAK